jgi:hypothetical protein
MSTTGARHRHDLVDVGDITVATGSGAATAACRWPPRWSGARSAAWVAQRHRQQRCWHSSEPTG